MNLDLRPLLALEVVLVMIVVAMIVWRKIVARDEDDQLHVLHAEAAVPQQFSVAKKLDQIDRWGKIMTVVAAAFGIAIAGLWIYQIWIQGSSTATFGA